MSRPDLKPRTHYRHWQPITTRWSDNDAYGHVNNAIFYHWFDTAVNTWLASAGLLDIAQGDLIGLVVQSQCRYASALSYPQEVEIGLAIDRLGSSSVTYGLGAFATSSADAAAEASFTHVYVDRATRRPVALPEAWRAAMAVLTEI
ncbi:MAG: thioesterase family protein [Pseudomonadota bacterium]